MKNKLLDLNNHLFEQLEKLNDDDLKGAELEAEIERSHAMAGIAKQIINTGSLALKAKRVVMDGLLDNEDVPASSERLRTHLQSISIFALPILRCSLNISKNDVPDLRQFRK